MSGADEAWYDPGSNRFYLAAVGMTSTGSPSPIGYPSPVIGVIACSDKHSPPHWIENIPTSATGNPHSVAANPRNGQVFLPIGGYGVAVFAWKR